MNTKTPESWAIDPTARALRVELPDGRTLLLKHDHLIYAEMVPAENEQLLTLYYTTHEVRIHGHALRRIETALQRMELSAISAGPRPFGRRPVDGQPVIRELVVTEVEGSSDSARAASD